jgi:hypothetical protein
VALPQFARLFPYGRVSWPGSPASYGGTLSRGHTAIAGPDGVLIAGPVTEREEILYAEVDPAAVLAARREFDPVGHYARPDVFHLSVDTTPRRPVTFSPYPLSIRPEPVRVGGEKPAWAGGNVCGGAIR